MKAIKYLICVFLLVSSSLIYSQIPDTIWTKTIGGISGDWGFSVQQTTDKGYIITGRTVSFGSGNADVWLIKTDSSGDTLWTKTFGGNANDEGYSVRQTSEGGYILTGYTGSYSVGGVDVFLIRTDDFGNTLWTKTFGGNEGGGVGRSIEETTDNGFIIVGRTSFGAGGNDVWLIKTNASGDTIWTKTFGGRGSDEGNSIQQTTDGGYIITGYTTSFGTGLFNIWLIKTDVLGNTLWIKTYDGSDDTWGQSVQQTTDGGFIIAGTIFQNSIANYDIFLIKTDATGDTLWTRSYGGILDAYGESGQQTTDGGYIIIGRIEYYDNKDIWLIKTDAFGDTLWTKSFGGIYDEVAPSIQQTTDGGYIFAGYTNSFGAGYEDVWLVKTTPDISNIKQDNGIIISNFELSQNYPNPFNPVTSIQFVVGSRLFVTLKVFDVLGNEIATLVNEEKQPGIYEVEFNSSSLKHLPSSGIYFYQLKAGDYVETKKMILLK